MALLLPDGMIARKLVFTKNKLSSMENFASSMQGCYPICMVLLQHSFLLVSYASFFAAIIQGHNPSLAELLLFVAVNM